ncbi:MAG: hypothetical protein ABI124_00810 [Terrimesophilobacter sp.]
MDGDTLQQSARDRVEELPGGELEHPIGPGAGITKQLIEILVHESYDLADHP